ncbi:MAG: PH domain-containing protein [Pseudomonadota bacterium]
MSAANTIEPVIWEGSPSQWINFPTFLLCALFCWLVLPIFYAFWRWLETRCFTYSVTTDRIIMRQGVFSKRTDELELYRVKDATLLEPFWLRLVSLGRIVLTTSDRTTPIVQLNAVPDAAKLREEIRRNVERLRAQKGIREMDVGEVVR